MKFNYLLIAFTLLISQSALASSLQQQLSTCSAVDNDIVRLQCFDKLSSIPALASAAAMKATTTTKSSKPSVNNAQLVQNKNEIFGFEAQQTRLTPEQLSVTVSSISKGVRGQLTFTLKNGQVWKQKDNTSFRLKADKQVYIKKGALGSFFLGQEGRNKKIRVKRLK